MFKHAENCVFQSEGEDGRGGEWGYCSCSGIPQFKCEKCGQVIDEEYAEVLDEDGCVIDDNIVTTHMCLNGLIHYSIQPIENPQMKHAEACFFRAMPGEMNDPENPWRGECGYCSCFKYPQVRCKICGAIIDEEYIMPTGPDDDRDDEERNITSHVCKKAGG